MRTTSSILRLSGLALAVVLGMLGPLNVWGANVLQVSPPVTDSGFNDNLTGDHPLTTALVWQGNGGVVVTPLAVEGLANPSGTLVVDSIPNGSTIVYACFATTGWQASVISSSCTFNGTPYGAIQPIASDDADPYYLCFYKWNVTSAVTGNGNYSFSAGNLNYCYGVYLVVIYANPTSPLIRIVINDGSEALANSSSLTSFIGFAQGSGVLRVFTQAGDLETSGAEAISFNGQTLAGPGNIFDDYADYFEFTVTNVSSASNSLTVTTGNDWIGIHLAVLTGSVTGSSLDVTMTPINPPIVIPSNGGSFNFTATVQRNAGPATPFYAWARNRDPNGSYSGNLLGPVNINPPVGVTVSRQRTQVVDAGWPAGVNYYIGYAGPTVSYPATDADSFMWTKLTSTDGGPMVWESYNYGEPFPGEIINIPATHTVLGNYPNPFNPSTVLSYELRVPSLVNLKVYDTAGRLVATLVDGVREAGTHSVTFDGSNLASGVYVYTLSANGQTATAKMVLMK